MAIQLNLTGTVESKEERLKRKEEKRKKREEKEARKKEKQEKKEKREKKRKEKEDKKKRKQEPSVENEENEENEPDAKRAKSNDDETSGSLQSAVVKEKAWDKIIGKKQETPWFEIDVKEKSDSEVFTFGGFVDIKDTVAFIDNNNNGEDEQEDEEQSEERRNKEFYRAPAYEVRNEESKKKRQQPEMKEVKGTESRLDMLKRKIKEGVPLSELTVNFSSNQHKDPSMLRGKDKKKMQREQNELQQLIRLQKTHRFEQRQSRKLVNPIKQGKELVFYDDPKDKNNKGYQFTLSKWAAGRHRDAVARLGWRIHKNE
eukprot:TRINITY_DN6096_c1_g2_i1.p1 TRINITY_DN6096_c1_g2~~TRINITY_DN6096_c1_g2_i1.p1  ORF type:complete len:315 (-),score=142.03 TRINITY_DN6096_c1_g2_i1:29-973(-)